MHSARDFLSASGRDMPRCGVVCLCLARVRGVVCDGGLQSRLSVPGDRVFVAVFFYGVIEDGASFSFRRVWEPFPRRRSGGAKKQRLSRSLLWASLTEYINTYPLSFIIQFNPLAHTKR